MEILTMQNNVLKNSTCWNPYNFNGRKVEKIKFFKDGQILASINWFTRGFGSNNRVPLIALPQDILIKRKEDLNKSQIYYFNECIYIYADLVNFKELGEFKGLETDKDIRYYSRFSVDLNCSVITPELNELGELEHKKSDLAIQTITEDYAVRFEEKPEFIKARELAEEMNEKLKYNHFSSYTIFDLLKEYNITKK
jgi:hypothetical protein